MNENQMEKQRTGFRQLLKGWIFAALVFILICSLASAITLDFTDPTLSDRSYIFKNHAEVKMTIDSSSLDAFKFNWDNGTSTNYSFYDDSLVLALNFNNNSAIGECYDNETEILTEEGWKYFWELNKDEKVLTLNPKTKEKEWQKPTDYAVFNSSGEMYEITLEDGTQLLVSPEHRVYGKFENKKDFISSVEKTLIKTLLQSSFGSLSSDQIGVLSRANDKATYGTSSLSEQIFFASGINSSNLSNLNNSITFLP